MNCLEGLTSLPSGLSISGGSGSVGGLSKGILDMKIGTFDSRAARAEGIATGAGIPGLAPDLVKSTSQLLQQQQAIFCASHQKSKAFLIHLVSILGAIDCFLCGFNHPYVATESAIEMLHSYRNCRPKSLFTTLEHHCNFRNCEKGTDI